MLPEPTARPVVVLRQPARTVRIAAALQEHGLQAYALPLTDVELPSDVDAVVAGLSDLGQGAFDWLVLTSGNTVQALVHLAGLAGLRFEDLVRSGDVRLAAVGSSTARLLAEEGLEVQLVPDEASSAGLLARFPRGSGAVLLPQADLAPDTLRAGLAERGWAVRRLEAYRTVAYPADPLRALPGIEEEGPRPRLLDRAHFASLLRRGVQPAVVFTAPSTVRQFREMLGNGPPAFVPVAIGATTARALRTHGWEPGGTAADPTPQGVADAVVRAFSATDHPAHPHH